MRLRLRLGNQLPLDLIPDVSLPDSISGLYLWNKGTDVTLSGADVDTFTDKSGNGRDLTVASAGDRPLFNLTGINGQPTADFNGSSHKMQWTGVSFGGDLPSGCEIFVVAQHDDDPASVASEAGWWDCGVTGAATLKVNTDGAIYDGFGSITRTFTGNPSADLTNAHLYNVITQSGEWTSNINGVQHFTTGTNTVGWEGTCRFGVGDGDSNWFKGKLAEIIIYNRKLTDPERDTVEAYVSSEYGITI